MFEDRIFANAALLPPVPKIVAAKASGFVMGRAKPSVCGYVN
jgi:hypothetical protein